MSVSQAPAQGVNNLMTTANHETDAETSPVEALINSGKLSDNADITEIAAFLNGTADEPDPAGKEVQTPPAAEDPKKDEAAAATAQPADEAAKAISQTGDTPATSESESANAGEDPDRADPQDDPNFKKHPIYGALKGTRKAVAEAKQRAAELEAANAALLRQVQDLTTKASLKEPGVTADVQQAVDDAGMVDRSGNPIDVTKVNLKQLREDYDGPLVDIIETLVTATQHQAKEIKDLRATNQQREAKDEAAVKSSVQDVIDSIPTLAQWQAEADTNPMFDRAVALDNQLRQEAEWQNKSMHERFAEVVRLMGGEPTPKGAKTTTTTAPAPKPAESTKDGEQKVTDALKSAAAKSAPISMSDLPTGSPPAQSEQEALEGLSTVQLAEKMERMNGAQLDEFLRRMT